MYDPLSLKLEKKQSQNLKQTQKLIMSPQMQQSIKLLQLPIMELEQLIEQELEQNPLLEIIDEHVNSDESDEEYVDPVDRELEFEGETFEVLQDLDDYFERHFSETENYCLKRTLDEEKQKSYLENSIRSVDSVGDLLFSQSREEFDTPEELHAAYILINSLEPNGFLTTSLEELSTINQIPQSILENVLEAIQTFDPPGIGAKDIQECLLLQLKRLPYSHFLAYQIVEKHYDDLLHNRIKNIAKGLRCTEKEVAEAISSTLSSLDLQPGQYLSDVTRKVIIPDIQIISEGDELKIFINDEAIPDLQFSKQYLNIALDPSTTADTKQFINQKVSSAKWLIRNIMQRSDTLERLSRKIVEAQKKFFTDSHGQLVPMTMKQVADELELHESTVARAVANKYLSCDRGTFSLRYFFTNAIERDSGGQLSSTSVKDLLVDMIERENKKKPYSDEALSKLLKMKGIQCARRTVAKYRTELNIGNTQQRKQYC